jgi:protein-ribulosamine 3-kinase
MDKFPTKLFDYNELGGIKGCNTIHGGSINDCFHIEFKNKQSLFVKQNKTAEFPGMFEAEAKGIKLMRSGGLLCPNVIKTHVEDDQQYLVLSYHAKSTANSIQWENAGKMLARMHQTNSPHFGLDHSNYMGSLVQKNDFENTFHEFFILQRLLPQLRIARDSFALNDRHSRQFDNLFSRLENLFPTEKPALVHGDLWIGNLHPSTEGVYFIDPAVAFSHREVDLAMTSLFGQVSEAFYRGYEEEFPTEKHLQERFPLYNLYPLLVHLNLFGNSYQHQIDETLKRFAL